MAGHWTKDATIVRGVIRRRELGYFAVCDDELLREKVPHASITEWNATKWLDGGKVDWDAVRDAPAKAPWLEGGQLKWDVMSMAVVKHPREQMIAIGEYGKAWLLGSGDRHEENIADGKISPKDRGTMRVVRTIDGRAYAAGLDRQVYRRDGEKTWTCIDASMRPPEDSDDILGFEGIDGFSAKDIYAAGWDGEIWRYDGKKWKPVDSPTNQTLTNLLCGGDDNVYACGRLGLLLRGRGNRWQVIDHDSTEEDLWGLAWYGGTLWLSSLTQIYTLEEDELVPVEFDDEQPETCNHLSTADGVLWSIGPKDVFAFDGHDWERID